jgi:hypothetical protein
MNRPDVIQCRGLTFFQHFTGKWYVWEWREHVPQLYSIWQVLWFALTGRGVQP